MPENNSPVDLSEVRSRGRATAERVNNHYLNVGDTVWCVEWSHKHGVDLSVHTTEEGAGLFAMSICVDYIKDWVDGDAPELAYSPEKLLEYWADITGSCEFITIHGLRLNR